jgi:hypothetical protein
VRLDDVTIEEYSIKNAKNWPNQSISSPNLIEKQNTSFDRLNGFKPKMARTTNSQEKNQIYMLHNSLSL